jgi:hypothetical protein
MEKMNSRNFMRFFRRFYLKYDEYMCIVNHIFFVWASPFSAASRSLQCNVQSSAFTADNIPSFPSFYILHVWYRVLFSYNIMAYNVYEKTWWNIEINWVLFIYETKPKLHNFALTWKSVSVCHNIWRICI